jgi:trans-2,3-dihydro-3-hydroxyanthranilate isomerase
MPIVVLIQLAVRASTALECSIPLHGIAEDPATGSAAGALVGLLAEQEGLEGRGRYEIFQGEEMLRPSRIVVDVTRDNGQILETQITGHCVEVIKGTFTLS